MKLGKERVLFEFDGDGKNLASPGLLESLGQALAPSVVLINEADVVEALVSGDLGEDRPLGAVGEGVAEEEAVICDGGEEGRGGGGADGGDLFGTGNLRGHGEGGGAGVGADDSVDASGIYEQTNSLEGDVGIAGSIDGEAFNRLIQDATGLIQMHDGKIKGLLAGL